MKFVLNCKFGSCNFIGLFSDKLNGFGIVILFALWGLFFVTEIFFVEGCVVLFISGKENLLFSFIFIISFSFSFFSLLISFFVSNKSDADILPTFAFFNIKSNKSFYFIFNCNKYSIISLSIYL